MKSAPFSKDFQIIWTKLKYFDKMFWQNVLADRKYDVTWSRDTWEIWGKALGLKSILELCTFIFWREKIGAQQD